ALVGTGKAITRGESLRHNQIAKRSNKIDKSLVMDLGTDSLPPNWQSYEMEPEIQATGEDINL
ncbi:hypothetical protein, partial [Zooshikella harenae]